MDSEWQIDLSPSAVPAIPVCRDQSYRKDSGVSKPDFHVFMGAQKVSLLKERPEFRGHGASGPHTR